MSQVETIEDAYPGIETWQRDVPQRPRRPTILGILVLSVGVLAFGGWAAIAPLDGAVVASGSFVATGQNKPVQHLEGGIIRDLLVREGDLVETGPDADAPRRDAVAIEAAAPRAARVSHERDAGTARRADPRRSGNRHAARTRQLPNDPDVAAIFDRQRMELKAQRRNRRTRRRCCARRSPG